MEFSYDGTLIKNFNEAVGFGSIKGYSRIAQIGHNPDVDVATIPEDIWSGGGVMPRPSVASTLEFSSDSVNDTSAGTGARSVFVSGVDTDYNVVSETKSTNGTSAVTTTNSYLRVNTFIVMSAGSTETNEGNITLQVSGGGSVMAVMEPVTGIASSSGYTVPAGNTLSISSLVLSVNKGGGTQTATIRTVIRSPLGFYRMPLILDAVSSAGPYLHETSDLGIVLPEKTDFSLRCVFTSTNNMDLTAGWIGILKSNSV